MTAETALDALVTDIARDINEDEDVAAGLLLMAAGRVAARYGLNRDEIEQRAVFDYIPSTVLATSLESTSVTPPASPRLGALPRRFALRLSTCLYVNVRYRQRLRGRRDDQDETSSRIRSREYRRASEGRVNVA